MKILNLNKVLFVITTLGFFGFIKVSANASSMSCLALFSEDESQSHIPGFLNSDSERDRVKAKISESIINALITENPSQLWKFKLSPTGSVFSNMDVIDFVSGEVWQKYLIDEVARRSGGLMMLTPVDASTLRGYRLIMGPASYFYLSKGNQSIPIAIGPYIGPIEVLE